MFLIFDPAMESTSGQAERGPGAAQCVDRVIDQIGCLGIGCLEALEPGRYLAGLVDIPITHSVTIANPIVERRPRCLWQPAAGWLSAES